MIFSVRKISEKIISEMFSKAKRLTARDSEYASLTGYDHSLIRTLLLEREKKNLEARLLKIEQDRQKLINNFAQKKESTLLDLCGRVRKRSTSLEELSKLEGETESIKISRRESLNMLRRNNDRIISNAARWVFHRPYKQNDRVKLLKKQHSLEKQVLADEQQAETETQQTTKLKTPKRREKRYAIQMRVSTPKSSKTEPLLLPRITPLAMRAGAVKRPFTWRSNTFHRHMGFSGKVTIT